MEQSARREALGTGLRRAYQKVLSEPIPDEFSQLLDRLSQSDGKEDLE
ncbi:MAG: transcriptional regulator [Alphaproteobacteria bacterium HGW-Alphaproteobacteria-12]|nr:MAG: transcriptional regulator [Alphaproteobacteria bacterium HGW-Alphaproteobacteria-12]